MRRKLDSFKQTLWAMKTISIFTPMLVMIHLMEKTPTGQNVLTQAMEQRLALHQTTMSRSRHRMDFRIPIHGQVIITHIRHAISRRAMHLRLGNG
jgi:uncharacterized membrane protein